MELKTKTIRKEGIPAAIAKAERYRYLNEPEEAESICRDVLEVDAEHQMARQILALAITDQFNGGLQDRFAEAAEHFGKLTDAYTREYYSGIAHERRAKA